MTFLIPMTFYNLWNLAQQQEFNHIHWCNRQNKAPLHSDRDMTSKVQSLGRLAGDPQGQLQWFCLWSTCNLWLCLLITPTEILHLHCVPECFVPVAWTLLFSYQRIILYYFISLLQLMSASQQFQGVHFQGLWFSHHCKIRGFGFMLVLFFLPQYGSSPTKQPTPLICWQLSVLSGGLSLVLIDARWTKGRL